MFWWTGCIGCGPTCGGRRGRSEPERAGGEQADARAGVLRRRRLAGKAAVEAVGALAVAAPLVVRSRGLFPGGGGPSAFASTRAHGTDAPPATKATGLRRPPHQQNHRSGLWRPVAAVAAFCVPTTPAAPG